MQKRPNLLRAGMCNALTIRVRLLTVLIILVTLASPACSVYGQQWASKSSGLNGGTLKAIWAHDNLMLAGTESAGIFRSTDGGLSWKSSNSGLTNKEITSFLASGDSIFVGTFFGGVHLSLDKGQTWQLSSTGLSNTQVTSLYKLGKFIFAGTVNGIFRSSDIGKSWQSMSQGLPVPTNTAYQFEWINNVWSHGNKLFAAVFFNGLFVSVNQGQTWTRETSIANTANIGAFVAHGEVLFMGVWNDGIHASVDGGETWSKLLNGLENETAFAAHSAGGKIYIGTPYGLFMSANNGSSFTELNIGYPIAQVIAITSSSKGIFVGMRQEGLVASTDGNTWTPASEGITATLTSQLTLHKNDLYATTANGLFRSKNVSESWNAVVNSFGQLPLSDLVANGDSLIASTYSTLYFSTDKGVTWNFLNQVGLGSGPQLKLAHRGDLYATTQTGLYVLRKGKSVWEKAIPSEGFQYYSNMVASGDTLVASTWDAKVYVSGDNGKTWRSSNTGLPAFYSVQATALHGNRIIVSLNDGMYKSEDLGITWTKGTSPGSGLSVMALHTTGTHLFAGTFLGVYFSRDSGQTWISANDDKLKDIRVQSFFDYDGQLYAGTTEGIFATSLTAFQPEFHSFEPTSAVPGQNITIKGKNFSSDIAANSVKVNGVTAQILLASPTTIGFKIPDNAVSGPISLTSGGVMLTNALPLCVKVANLSISKSDTDEGALLTSSAAVGNQWYVNDVVIPNATNKTLVATSAGTYKVRVSDPVCFTEASYTLIITSIEGVENLTLAYPVPMTDVLTIKLNQFNTAAHIHVEILDSTGSSLQKSKVNGGADEISINTSEINPGIYFLRVRQNSKTRFQRLIKL